MKKSPLFPLCITFLAAAALLLGVTWALRGITERNARAQHHALLQTLLPDSTQFVTEAYHGDDGNVLSVHRGETGYVVEAATDGYAGTVSVMTGVSSSGAVTGLTVRRSHETLGLGSRILRDEAFLSQFLGLSGEAEVGSNIDAITGATVSSRAVARCVNSAIAVVTGADITTEATGWGG